MTIDKFLVLLFEKVCPEAGMLLRGTVADYAYGDKIANPESTTLTRKFAALILHEFLVKVLKVPDVEWGEASLLSDIYDCAVCANAIAQTYQRGLIKKYKNREFGINEEVSAKEAEVIAEKLKLLASEIES